MKKNKKCYKCSTIKPIEEFSKNKSKYDGFSSECKCCAKIISKNWRLNNKDKKAKSDKRWQDNNKEKCDKKKRDWYENNKDLTIDRATKWNKKNKEHRRKYINKYFKDRRKNDKLFYIRSRVYNTISNSFRSKNFKKNKRYHEILGCTIEYFAKFIEDKFVDGMSWDNKGDWHIDHKIPQSSAKSEEEVYKLNHYSNFQPLWATENIIKRDRI